MLDQHRIQNLEQARAAGDAAAAAAAVVVVDEFEAEEQGEVLQALDQDLLRRGRFGYGLAGDAAEDNYLSGLGEEASFRNGFADSSGAARNQPSNRVAKTASVNQRGSTGCKNWPRHLVSGQSCGEGVLTGSGSANLCNRRRN